jgi:hypothetical protein
VPKVRHGPVSSWSESGAGSERQEFTSVAYCCQQGVKCSLPEPPGEIRFDRKGAICDYGLLFYPILGELFGFVTV